jgi:purine nucleosidase
VLEAVGLAGRIPIAIGDTQSLERNRKIWMPGHEGKIAHADQLSDAVVNGGSATDFILEQVSAHPGEVVIVAIAPLVNIAQAILENPKVMRGVQQIVIMGGVFGVEDRERRLPIVEHNIVCDPEAARVVFGSGLPITLFPLDVTLRTPLVQPDIDALGTSGHPLARLLHEEIVSWLAFIKREFNRDRTELHDPVTVASLIDPRIITRSFDAAIKIECDGQHTSGMTIVDHSHGKNIRVVTEVDISRFYELFSARVVEAFRGVPSAVEA